MQTSIKNTTKNQDFSNTTAPDYEQGRLDSLSRRPTYPTKPRFIPTLDGYDILNRASGEWYAIAAECGIDGQKLHGLINRNQTIYKRGIELNKSYKGKVWVYVRFKTAKSGQEYVTITFKTFKHGEVKAYFNGWEWLENNGTVGKKEDFARPSSATTADDRGEFRVNFKLSPEAIAAGMEVIETPKPESAKFKPVQTIAARACVACKTDFIPLFENSTHCEYCYKLSKFDSTHKHFNRLKPIEETSRLTFEYRGVLGIVATLNKSYLAKKGFTIEDIKASGLDVKRGRDIRGAFVMVQAVNSEGKITGYQKIYDSKFVGYDGELRDKDFCFFPKKDSVTGEVKTLKTGSYVVLGSLDNADKGVYYCEGLATGLSVFKATGKTTIVCFDAGGLMAVVNQFPQFTKRYIAADNDMKAGDTGNVGIYSALRVAESLKARVFVPVATDTNLKVDFNDLEQLEGLETVKLQLRTRSNPNEVSPSRETLFKYCPKEQLKALAERHCLSAAGSISTKAQFKSHSNALQTLFNNRGFTEFKARKYIFSILKGRVQFMQSSNCFSGHELVTRIDVQGLSNQAIAAKVATLQGLVIDNRGMAAGKTELMRLIAEQLKTASSQQTARFDDVKNYHSFHGGTAEQWEKIRNNPKLFKDIQDKLKAEPAKRHRIAAIAHRTSLIDSLSNRLGLPHYDKIDNFNPTHLAVCVNSIVKFESVKPTVLFIDEFRQTLEHLHNGTVENRISVNNQLIKWINGAGLVIAADADFNEDCLEWILTNCPTMPVYWLDNGKQQSNGKTIELLEGNQFVINNLIGNAVIEAQAGGRVWLAFDGITQAKKAYANFIAAGIAADKILLVHSENKADLREAEFLDNPNEVSENYQVIIHTPVISSGVSITKEFDFVGAGFCGVLPPNELLQTVARVRTAKNIYVALMPNNDYSRPERLQDLEWGESTKRGRYCEEAGSLTLTSFDKFRLKQVATTNQALNNYEQYFKILAQLKGYTLKESRAGGVELLVSTKDVKAIVCSEILSSNDITESEFLELDKKTATTQAESNAIFKYQARKMAGKSALPSPADLEYLKDFQEKHPYAGANPLTLTKTDINFFKYDNGVSKVKNAELVNADIAELKEQDRQNHETRQKLSSETSKAFLFSYVINALSGQPVKRVLIQQCLDFLKTHGKEAAANELRNTRDLFKFVERAGYELIEESRTTTGGREPIYLLQLNPLVAEYLQNRARLKSEAKEQTESELMPEFEF